MIWRIPGISLNLHYPKEDDGELYTACPIIKGSRGIEPLNPLPQRRIRLTLPAYLCLKTALRRSEIREYYTLNVGVADLFADKSENCVISSSTTPNSLHSIIVYKNKTYIADNLNDLLNQVRIVCGE